MVDSRKIYEEKKNNSSLDLSTISDLLSGYLDTNVDPSTIEEILKDCNESKLELNGELISLILRIILQNKNDMNSWLDLLRTWNLKLPWNILNEYAAENARDGLIEDILCLLDICVQLDAYPKRDFFNRILGEFSHTGDITNALLILKKMKEFGIRPENATYRHLLDIYGKGMQINVRRDLPQLFKLETSRE